MAWEARSGLKPDAVLDFKRYDVVGMAWEARSGLKQLQLAKSQENPQSRNGLGSPFGIETASLSGSRNDASQSEWPGKPVRD